MYCYTIIMAPLPKVLNKPTKTYLSKRGYAIDKDGFENATTTIDMLKQLLTVKPKTHPDAPGASEVVAFPVFQESSKKLYIPRALGFQLFGAPTHDTLHEGDDAPGLVFAGIMRPEQKAPTDAFLIAAKDPSRGGGIVSVACAGGKTVMGLYISTCLKKKTLIICHKEFLLNQWRERIGQFVPSARVGIIKAKKVEVDGCDIVLASLQSLSMKDYDPAVLGSFGLVIADECHHLSAQVFCQALPKVTSRVFLGLSATLDRKDGLRKVFEWYLGPPVYESKVRTESQMIVRMVPYCDDDPLMNYGVEKYMWNGKRNVAAMLSALCAYAPRTLMIVDLLEEVLKKEPERKTLVLSDRRGHLKELERLLRERGYVSIGYYVGGMKEAELKASESKDILLATLAMSAEGMDIPALNTLVLATPVSAIEQPIGRIQRQKPSERTHTPMTIDVWDQYSLYYNQGRRRRDFYFKSGYVVEKIEKTESANDEEHIEDDADKASTNMEKTKVKKPRKTKAPVRMHEEKHEAPVMESDDEDTSG